MFERYIIIDIEGMIADYEDNKATLESLDMQYKELCAKDIGSIDYSKDRVQTSPTNDGMANDLIRKVTLERQINAYESDLALYEMAWGRLTDKEKFVLLEFTQHRRKQDAVDNICDKYGIEYAQAYNLRKDALIRFRQLMFG